MLDSDEAVVHRQADAAPNPEEQFASGQAPRYKPDLAAQARNPGGNNAHSGSSPVHDSEAGPALGH